MKILGTGLNGLMGSRITELLSDVYEFENVSRSTGVDITNPDQVFQAISDSKALVVMHLAAYTDVKTAEKEKDLGKDSEAWKINVLGTQNVAAACQKLNKKMIHFSTDLVVGGDDMPEGGFTEEAAANPLNWYAKTKYEGELTVKNNTTPWVIIRPAYPYRKEFTKPDFVRFFKELLSSGKPVSVLTDRIITPTFIDDLAFALKVLIEKDATGIYNVVGSQILSIFDAVNIIAEKFNLDKSLIGKNTRAEFLVDRPSEPFSSALNNAKIKQIGAVMHTFEEGLDIIKNS
jgi:dTDP-4-dehydrorhamnose reductase